jgi:hypothetical protein
VKTITLHQSQLSTYLRCPELFRRQWFGLVEDGPTDATAVGTALHAYAEQRINGAPQDQARDEAYSAWCVERDNPLFRMVKVKQEMTALGHLAHCCDLWEDRVLPQLGDPVYVEKKFSLPFVQGSCNGTDVQIDLEGTIDFADWSLKDWKTASDGRKYQAGYGGEGWQLQRWGIQATVYCWAALQLGDLDDPLTFDWVAVEKTQPNVHWLTATRNETHFKWLKQLCWNVVTMLESGLDEWPLDNTSALCSQQWCPAWDTCVGGPLNIPNLRDVAA